MNGSRSVVITGLGLLSALGDDVGRFGEALRGGESGLVPVAATDGKAPVDGPVDLLADLPGDLPGELAGRLSSLAGVRGSRIGSIRGFAAERYLGSGNLRPLDRAGRLVAAAAALALADARIPEQGRRQLEVGLVLGTMFGSVHTISAFDRRAITAGPSYAKPMDFANTVINAPAGQTAIWHGLTGVSSTVSAGTASGLLAILYAAQLIRGGQSKVVLAGGGDELCAESLVGFQQAGLLAGSAGGEACSVPFDARRNGLALGEGAALLVLEEETAARERGARIRARITGGSNRFDPSAGADPERARSVVVAAIRDALADGGCEHAAVDAVSASANGSVAGDRAEASALCEVFGGSLLATAVKSMTGEALGASGALQAAGLLCAMESGVLPGIRGLERLESGVPAALASASSRTVEVRRGLVTAVGLDGQVGVLVLEEAA